MKPKLILLLPIALLAGILYAFQKGDSPRFLKGNMHAHSFWSDGNTYPEEVVKWYRQHGYQFLALTDHNGLQSGIRYRVSGKDSVKLREFSDFSREFDKPGEFLLLYSEEITDASEKRPVHLNGFNLLQPVKPAGGPTVAECVNANVRAIRQALEPSGNPEWITINHPNFGWGLTADHLARCGARFFEVYNGHPSVRNYGDSIHPGTEVMWDEANKWRVDHGLELLLGTATDDAHQYDTYGVGKANPGRGWTMVRASGLTPGSLYRSMMSGDFYASTGVELADFTVRKGKMTIRIQPVKGIRYVTEFTGWIRGHDHPEILKSVEGTKAVYQATGKELFVRATVISDAPKSNPFSVGEVEMAWLQPFVPIGK